MLLNTEFFVNKNFRCQCGLKIGLCDDINHPKKLEWQIKGQGIINEGWALGKYQYRKSKWGQYVYDFKWQPSEGEENDKNRRDIVANEVYTAMQYFWKNYFIDGKQLFNYVYPIPGSTGEHPSLARALAERFEKHGIRMLPEFIQIDRSVNSSSRGQRGSSLDEKMEMLNKKFTWNGVQLPENINGVLIIDDVYETGASIRRSAQILSEIYDGPLFFMAVAYIFEKL